MCGILGVATVRGRSLSVSGEAVARLRDTMARRGPDGAGLWRHEHVALAHRRLAVVDCSEAAGQPMLSADGRHALVYNGELYNDAEVRAALETEGATFRTRSDTETVLAALAMWGAGALARLRGMYALGWYDTVARRLLLARDPLGIKPLYYALTPGGQELVFASEPRAVLAHPGVPARPDLVGVSAYLSTIRTVMGTRTLFEGVRTLRPGQAVMVELGGETLEVRPLPPVRVERVSGASTADVRGVIEDSVRRHLRSDVPVCCLLSGGLDSSVVASVARDAAASGLRTYCAGSEGGADFAFAREMAATLGTMHTEAVVSREMFAQRWAEMVGMLGVPLSTPNEVAINEVARILRGDGMVVALSGEGADELFGGYDGPMRDAARFEGLIPPTDGGATRASGVEPGHFQLDANSWIPVANKSAVLGEDVWRAVERDEHLREFYRVEFESLDETGAERGRDAKARRVLSHLRFHRRINLAGLLQRLDTATMLEGVEGRTPFADSVVAAFADGLGLDELFMIDASDRAHTKRALRSAFAGSLPRGVLERPKASFPLPFEEWVADSAGVLRTSALARELFTPAAISMVSAEPARLWRLAWPMINIARWGSVWW